MFDTALIESAAPHAGVHLRAAKSLPLAIAFHAAVIGALVFSALASTADPPEPVISIAFPDSFRSNPPPPPPGGPEPIRAVLPPVKRNVDTPVIRLPEELPPVDPQPQDSNIAENHGEDFPGTSTGPGEPGGQPGGRPDGVPGGIAPEDGAGVDPNGAAIHEVGVGGVTAPEILERIEPIYPEAARKARIQGVVTLEAIITAAGIVEEVRVVGSGGAILDASAVAAVRRWKYHAATLRGRAVAVRLTVMVRFGLNG